MRPSEFLDQVKRVFEQSQQQLLLLAEILQTVQEPPEVPIVQAWMTKEQLAEYLQLRNNAGEFTTAGIDKWTKRPLNEFPLPCGCAGDLRRFHRDDVDRWLREEAKRRRVANEESRLSNPVGKRENSVTHASNKTKMPPL